MRKKRERREHIFSTKDSLFLMKKSIFFYPLGIINNKKTYDIIRLYKEME